MGLVGAYGQHIYTALNRLVGFERYIRQDGAIDEGTVKQKWRDAIDAFNTVLTQTISCVEFPLGPQTPVVGEVNAEYFLDTVGTIGMKIRFSQVVPIYNAILTAKGISYQLGRDVTTNTGAFSSLKKPWWNN